MPSPSNRQAAVIQALRALVEPLATALGPGNEIVLHDLRHLDCSLVAIAGEVTSRSPGAPATDLVLKHFQSGRADNLLRYRGRTADGRSLCSSTIFLRDSRQEPYASICVNIDITEWLRAADLLATTVSTNVDLDNGPADPEAFTPSVEDLAVAMLNRAIAEVGVPVDLMRKEHRVEVVKRLDDAGMFLVQDGVVHVAAALQVSRFSVYKYLREVTENGTRRVGPKRTLRATTRPLPLPSEAFEQGENSPSREVVPHSAQFTRPSSRRSTGP